LSTPGTHALGVQLQHHSFVTSVLDGGKWTSWPSCFTPIK